MNKKKMIDFFGWGFVLWLIGYLLGIVLFMFIPQHLIGWFIMPVGIIITFWVLSNKIKSNSLGYYVQIAVVWTLIAVFFDYIFIVKMLKPADGYYKIDVYIYYLLTFVMPIGFGWYKSHILV